MKVAVVNFEGTVQSTAIGILELLASSAPIVEQMTGTPLPDAMVCDLLVFPLTAPIATAYDLVVVPAIAFASLQTVLEERQDVVEFLRSQHAQRAELASVCMGTFLLAETGLLHGRRATTHWLGAGMFRERYPNVLLEDGKVVVDQGRIYTCGGAFSYTTLMIYLLGKFYGPQVGQLVADVLMINVHDLPQSAFARAGRLQNHHDDAVLMAQRHLAAHYTAEVPLPELAALTGLPEAELQKRFQLAIQMSPRQYLQQVRIEAAKKFLQTSGNEEALAARVGTPEFPAFKRLFKRLVGLTPKGYHARQTRLGALGGLGEGPPLAAA